jgi:hypothetical protein
MSSDYAFYLVRQPTTLGALAAESYGQGSALAQDFIRANQPLVGRNGQLQTGQLLFLPEGRCYADEAQIIGSLRLINAATLALSPAERMLLVDAHPALHNLVESGEFQFGNPFRSVRSVLEPASIGGGVVAGFGVYVKQVGAVVGNLNKDFVASVRRTNGRPDAQFRAQRAMHYRTLEGLVGQFGRSIITGSFQDRRAKRALKINNKSEANVILNRGTDQVRRLQVYMNRVTRAVNIFRAGGWAFIALDAVLSYQAVQEICATGSAADCRRARSVQSGGLLGRAGGGAGGAAVAYWACGVGLAKFTFGGSFLACGVVAGGVGSIAGGYSIGKAGEFAGGLVDGGISIYEQRININNAP